MAVDQAGRRAAASRPLRACRVLAPAPAAPDRRNAVRATPPSTAADRTESLDGDFRLTSAPAPAPLAGAAQAPQAAPAEPAAVRDLNRTGSQRLQARVGVTGVDGVGDHRGGDPPVLVDYEAAPVGITPPVPV